MAEFSLAPQWLKSSGKGDDSKRAKPLDTGRAAAQQDPWGPRSSTTATGANGALQSERSSSNSGTWKPRDAYGPPSRSGAYQSLNHKPLSAREYSARGAYGGRSGESEGGAGPLPNRSLSERESWPATRGQGTRDEGSRSALLGPSGGGAGNGVAKVSFDKDFPSLSQTRPTQPPSAPAAAAQPAPPAAPTSPLLGPASSNASVTPFHHTFLSSRTSSNWTSKLAEAPPPPPTPPGGEDVPPTSPAPAPSFPPHASTPPSTPAAAAAVAPSTTSPTPPKPAGVWGASSGAAVAGAGAEGGGGGGVPSAAVASSRARLEQLAVKQSKQLIPVISSSGSKGKGGTGAGGLGSLSAGGRLGTGAKLAGAAAGPMVLKLPGAAKRAGEDGAGGAAGPLRTSSGSTAAAGATGTAAGGPVVLTKKLSQPLDRPLGAPARSSSGQRQAPAPAATTAATTASANAAAPAVGNAPPASPAVPAAAPGQSEAGGALLSLSPSPSVPELGVTVAPAPWGAEAGEGAAAGLGGSGAVVSEPGGGQAGSGVLVTAEAAVPDAWDEEDPALAPAGGGVEDGQVSGREGEQQEQQQQAGRGPVAHAGVLQVSAEEEAFLRSLGWTGFDEEDEDGGEDSVLTEEEIAAFRAQQQQQQQQQRTAEGAYLGKPPRCGPPNKPIPVPLAGPALSALRAKPLIVAASYGSEQLSSSDSDSECE